ncbi:nuclear pore glycoprotein p62, partial [Protopterus annectens]|uniref:nuclear pore glycoprotein p62 n=1 Tax=Protopterus annectens TaxID=7888 RepID=UPI001CFC0BF6
LFRLAAPKQNLGGTTQSSFGPGGFTFGNAPASTTTVAATTAAPTGFSFGSTLPNQTTTAAGFSFGASTTQPGFNLGGSTGQVGSSLSFGSTAPSTPAAPTGFSFGSANTATTTATSTQPAAPAFSLGGQSTGFSFASSQAAPAVAPMSQPSGFILGVKPTETVAPTPATTAASAAASITSNAPLLFASIVSSSVPATSATPSFLSTTTPLSGSLSLGFKAPPTAATATSLPTATGTGLGSGFSLKLTTTTITSTTASLPIASTTSIGLAATTTSATPSTIISTTATAATSMPSVMTYAQLESLINKWSLELEDQEKHFLHQATQVNAWDRMLIENGEKITSLHREVEKVKLDQKRLDQELDFILSQQKELEDLLCPLEESVKEQTGTIYLQHADEERERTYKLAENIDAQLKRMTQDLKEIIGHLNLSSGPADTSDPLQQICKILNAHMDSLQWIDQNSVFLQRKVEEVSKVYENRRKEQERSFRITFD